MKDNVNHPSHYETGKFECIEVMLETQGKEAVKNFCICNAFKYIYRHNNKNGVEDIKKAKWYLDKYIEIDESERTCDECKKEDWAGYEIKVSRAMENTIKEATCKGNKNKLVVTDKVLEDLVKGARKCYEDICNGTIHADNDKGVELKKEDKNE